MARINLIAWDNGRGLSHDIRLLRAALESLRHEVTVTDVGPSRKRQRLRALAQRLRLLRRWLRGGCRGSWRHDVNITLEHALPAYLGLARRNLFIPNPEWLSPRDERHLHRFDALLAKTRVATAIFAARGLTTRHIGFQSVDCLDRSVPREAGFLHLAGASRMKGTARLLAVWARHPEWPRLLVLQSAQTAAAMPDVAACANIEHRVGTVAEIAEIRRLQNAHAVHLCLSEAEGWGHYIVEAMSCGAVVLSCDAPPMNELVEADRGIPVAAHPTEPLNAAMRYAFDEAALEAAIERVRTTDAAELHALGERARAWFEANQRDFAARLEAALRPEL